mmetsp:Transcript_29645/g.45422  ORF Transcript_29645/g.45422 Transcript_29645/m.45422 type:complete len:323 (-) Transcript_29645:282-1250(-)|eukprot:CAMPEP_0118683448 /NCGR_PEP_ID=MMETSP0800-20121206/6053_1 /TAXON_ID=210618 ORGANISM="Striatella unipunctata, Strain CCMP2910" /NCGR_SAMPLE_ID=MMETSP0800 /ASSEMBLY_ACC=CAM_ASM_000638 /LENGTH=322 /DNA_ID=CAMNT_0006579963 /DNA_START=9 /DNA_END=977 /DNA_ORIENTATION=+
MPPSAKKKAKPPPRATKGKQCHEKLISVVKGAQVGTTWVDNPANISEPLIDEVTYKANCIKCFYNKSDGSIEFYYAQAGLLRGERLIASPPSQQPPTSVRRSNDGRRQPFSQSSRWEVTPVTALHNITNDSSCERYRSSKIYTSTRPSKTFPIEFGEGGKTLGGDDTFTLYDATEEEEAITWESHDKTAGVIIKEATHFLTKKQLSYETVSDSFTLEVGQKVGMAVYRTFDIEPEDAVAPEGTAMEEIYGPKFITCIYTGKITKVHARGLSFEHSINTFCGCSGAVIFLLEDYQGARVGKALAVHVGGHPNDSTRANVAFRI